MAAYVLTIAGVARALQPGWDIAETRNGPNLFTGAIVSTDGSYRPLKDDPLVLTEDGVRIFGGPLDAPAEGQLGVGNGIRQRVTAADFNVLADRRVVVIAGAGIAAGTLLGTAFTTVMGTLSGNGVTVDGAQAAGPALPAVMQLENATVRDWCDAFSTMFGWLWEVDYTKVARMWAPGTRAAPIAIVDGDGHAIGDITVTPAQSEYKNRIVLLCGTGTKPLAHAFEGDGATRVFALPVPSASRPTQVYDRTAAAYRNLGIWGIDLLFEWTYRASDNTIVQLTEAPPGNPLSPHTAGQFFDVIDYVGQYPFRVQAPLAAAEPTAAQTARGVQEIVLRAPDIFLLGQGQAAADGELTRRLAELRVAHYLTFSTGLHPGQSQTIVCARRQVNATCLLQEVRIRNHMGNRVRREVTALVGLVIQATWRDDVRSWGASSGGGSVATVVGGGGGGVGGVAVLSAVLGGSRVASQVVGTVSTPVLDWLPYVARASSSALVRVSTRARIGGVTVTPTLTRWTGAAWVAHAAGIGIASVVDVEQEISAALTLGDRYRLEYVTNVASGSAYAIGTLENL